MDYSALEKKYDLPEGTLAAVSGAESSNDPNTPPSKKGAEGLFQFMPDTAKSYNVNVHDAESSAEGAAHYLSDLKKQYGSMQAAFAHYNGGNAAGQAVVAGKQPPASETQNYLIKVNSKMKRPEGLGEGEIVDQQDASLQRPEGLGEGEIVENNNTSPTNDTVPLPDPANESDQSRELKLHGDEAIAAAQGAGLSGVITAAKYAKNLGNSILGKDLDPDSPLWRYGKNGLNQQTQKGLDAYLKSQLNPKIYKMGISDLEKEMTKLEQSIDPSAPKVKIRTMSEVQNALEKLKPTDPTFEEKNLPRGSIRRTIPGTPGVDTSAYELNPNTPAKNWMRVKKDNLINMASDSAPPLLKIANSGLGAAAAVQDLSDVQRYGHEYAAKHGRPNATDISDYLHPIDDPKTTAKELGVAGGLLSLARLTRLGNPLMAVGEIPDLIDYAKKNPEFFKSKNWSLHDPSDRTLDAAKKDLNPFGVPIYKEIDNMTKKDKSPLDALKNPFIL